MVDPFRIRTEVRAVVTTFRPTRSPLALLLLTVLALAGSACTPSAGPLGTPSTPAPSADASVEIPTNDATPGTPAPSDSTAPSSPAAIPSATRSAAPATATPAATPTPAPTTTETVVIRNYFFLGSFTGSGGLVPVLRDIPRTQTIGSAALRDLLAGPSTKESAASPAMYTDIPGGTRLLGLTIAGGVATVDLSSEFALDSAAGADIGRLAQVVYTLTQFSTVTGVSFELDGVPITSFSASGISLAHPITRADLRVRAQRERAAVLPNIFVDRPAWGAAAGNPVQVSGVANVFEAVFRVQLKNARGGLLVDRQVMASCGTGCWGDFSISIAYSVTRAQWGTLRVFDLSAKDGSPQDVTEYPIWLVPAG